MITDKEIKEQKLRGNYSAKLGDWGSLGTDKKRIANTALLTWILKIVTVLKREKSTIISFLNISSFIYATMIEI